MITHNRLRAKFETPVMGLTSGGGVTGTGALNASFASPATDGNLIILCVAANTTRAVTALPGWTEVPYGTTGNSLTFYVFYKIASSETNSYSIIRTPSGTCTYSMMEFSGLTTDVTLIQSPATTITGAGDVTPAAFALPGPGLALCHVAKSTAGDWTWSSVNVFWSTVTNRDQSKPGFAIYPESIIDQPVCTDGITTATVNWGLYFFKAKQKI